MPSLRAQKLCFAFQSVPVFDGLSFHLSPPWTGIVGANGLGKTTLLRLITGELVPTHGSVSVEPRGARVAFCPQRVEALGEPIADLAWGQDKHAYRLRMRLKLDAAEVERWGTLSPGERKRWQLGAALYTEPDVLLLDEPGNHLDAPGLNWLRETLRGFRGLGVLVSHDRALLDEATHATLRLTSAGARLWPLPFSAACAAWTEEEAAQRAARRETRKQLENEERKLDAKRRVLEAASRQRNTGARMKHRYDSDARSLGADFRAEQAQFAHAATLRRVEQHVDGLRTQLETTRVDDEPGQSLFVRYQPAPVATVVQFRGDVRIGDRVLLHDASVQLGRHERLWLRGPNGCGKSTLLRHLLGESCRVPEARRLTLPQELSVADSLADLEQVRALPAEEKGRVLQLVHALGVEPDQLLRSAQPSPGEARKLRLALGLGAHAWLAALDEPTHHLDLPAIERLEAALRDFPGALLLVTHDERLAQRCEMEPAELAWLG